MQLSKITLVNESSGHCWVAVALAAESASTPDVRERSLIMHFTGTYSDPKEKGSPYGGILGVMYASLKFLFKVTREA